MFHLKMDPLRAQIKGRFRRKQNWLLLRLDFRFPKAAVHNMVADVEKSSSGDLANRKGEVDSHLRL